jgi:hypothetical protein
MTSPDPVQRPRLTVVRADPRRKPQRCTAPACVFLTYSLTGLCPEHLKDAA